MCGVVECELVSDEWDRGDCVLSWGEGSSQYRCISKHPLLCVCLSVVCVPCRLGLLNKTAGGTKLAAAEAVHCFEVGVKHKFIPSMLSLASMYANGLGKFAHHVFQFRLPAPQRHVRTDAQTQTRMHLLTTLPSAPCHF